MQESLMKQSSCIICHESIDACHVVRPMCSCQEATFCPLCWSEYLVRGYRTCPVCRQPILAPAERTNVIPSQELAVQTILVVPMAQGQTFGSNQRLGESVGRDRATGAPNECTILTGSKLARRFYFAPIVYSILMTGIAVLSAMQITTLDTFCLCCVIVLMIIRWLLTGNWWVDVTGRIILERQGALVLPPCWIRSTSIVDGISFVVGMACLMIDPAVGQIVWTSAQVLFSALSCLATLMCAPCR